MLLLEFYEIFVLYVHSPTSTAKSTQKAQMLTERNVYLYKYGKL